jgi:hypothetical protein
MLEIIKNIDNQIIIFYFFFILFPFLLGWTVILVGIWTFYWDWVWKGMDENNSIIYFKYKIELNKNLLKGEK